MGNLKKLFCVPLWSYLLKDIKNEEIVEWSDKERKTNTGRHLTLRIVARKPLKHFTDRFRIKH